MKICLAVAVQQIEEWIKNKIEKDYPGQVTYTKEALHTGVVLSIIKEEKPDVLILKEDLPQGSSFENTTGGLSIGLLVQKIRTKYTDTRIIIIADNHKEGDKFFRYMVGVGIYDIAYREKVKLSDVVDMIWHPRDYGSVSHLQGLSQAELREIKGRDGVTVVAEKKKLPNHTKGAIEKTDSIVDIKPAQVSKPVQNVGQSGRLTSGQSKQTQGGFVKQTPVNNPPEPPVVQSTPVQPEPVPVQPQSQQVKKPVVVNHVLTNAEPVNDIEAVFEPEENIIPNTAVSNTKSLVNPNCFLGVIFEPVPKPESDSMIGDTECMVQPGFDPYAYAPYENEPQLQFQQNEELPPENYQQQASVRRTDNVFFLPKNKGKLCLFTAARDGVGCTTNALNTAYFLAKDGARVLLLDLNIAHSSVFPKLGIRDLGYGFDNLAIDIQTKDIGDVANMCQTRESIVRDSPRYNAIPPTLYFMKLSDQIAVDTNLFYCEEALNILLNNFEYVIVDYPSHEVNEDLSVFTTLCNFVFFSTTQDLYEIGRTKAYMQQLDMSSNIAGRSYICLTKYERGVEPSPDDVAKHFGARGIAVIPSDNRGFIRSAAGGVIYSSSGKKKVTVGYRQLAYYIKGAM